jgi:hypothetical protein
MTDITVSESVELADPKLRSIALRVGKTLHLAAEKAVAHHADPDRYPSDRDRDSLERIFLARLRELPAAKQRKVVATVMPSVKAGIVARTSAWGDLSSVDLTSSVPIEEQSRTLPFPPELTFPLSFLKSFPTLHGGVVALQNPQTLPQAAAGSPPESPARALEFRIHRLSCIDETGGALEDFCGTDTIFLSGAAIGATGATASLPELRIGAFDAGCVKEFIPPRPFCTFDLRQGADWPKAYFVTLVLSDLEMGNLAGFQKMLVQKSGEEVTSAIFAATGLSLGARGGLMGGIIGAMAAWVAGWIFNQPGSWWNQDVFPPKTISLEIPSRTHAFPGGRQESPLSVARLRGRDGEYAVAFDWRLAP